MKTKQASCFFLCVLISSFNVLSMEKNATKFNPKNTKFAFDFHGVVVTEPFSLWEQPSDIIKVLRWNFIPTFNQQLPWFIYRFLLMLWSGPSEENLINICTQYEQHDVITGVTDVANSIDVLTDTVAIMRELKEKGYDLDMASNIDSVFLNDLENNSKYPHIREVLALFTNKKAIVCSTINSKKTIRKPNIHFFTEYQKEHNTDEKQVIFIDDVPANVAASEKANMIGIHFQNPEQLRHELVKHGILQQNKK